MTWTELKKMPFVAVHCEGAPTENLLIRDRCSTCHQYTRRDLCPQRCQRFNEPPFAWTGPSFYAFMADDAVATYKKMYPEYCRQLTLF